MTIEEYRSVNDNKNYKQTPFQLREKDYMYMYSNEVYRIGEYEDNNGEKGIVQFKNVGTP